jgi:hypothetical protein
MENVLKSIGEDLGPAGERVLRRRLDRARYFMGGIDLPLDATTKIGSRTIRQFEDLLNVLAHPELGHRHGRSRPVFDRMNLSLAMAEATKTFHTRWRGRLGLDVNPDPRRNAGLASRRSAAGSPRAGRTSTTTSDRCRPLL